MRLAIGSAIGLAIPLAKPALSAGRQKRDATPDRSGEAATDGASVPTALDGLAFFPGGRLVWLRFKSGGFDARSSR
jgi:hypothetical protein